MLLGELVQRSARLYPRKVALVEGSRRYTWSQFRDRVNRLANSFLGLGLTPGDRVGVFAENCAEFIELYWALPAAGLIIVPLNYRMVGRELSYILNDSTCRALVVQDSYLSTTESIRPEVPSVEHRIHIGDQSSSSDYLPYEALVDRGDPWTPEPSITESDIAYIMYTSGTTGKPKGAVLSHRNLRESSTDDVILNAMGSDDVVLNTAPLFHSAAAVGMRAHVQVGGANVVISGFDPRVVLETIQRERITSLFLAPVMISALLSQPDLRSYDLSSVKHIAYGAAPMPVEVLKRAMAVFGQHFIQGYGTTETGAAGTLLNKSDHVADGTPEQMRRLASAGREWTGVHVRVVDESGSDVESGQIGELIVRGPCVMRGYWKQPEATAEVLRDGWYHTGDMATMDEDRYVYIVDRKRDLIISGGENIYPREVEEVLYMHPAVQEAAVIGVPDDYWGESVKAFVVLRPGLTATEDELIAHCKENIAGYKKPRTVEFRDQLPHTTSGKVLKTELREPYWRNRVSRV